MVTQGFYVMGGDWYVMGYYGISGDGDLDEVYKAIISTGVGEESADEAISVLRGRNAGYTLSDFSGHYTVMFVSEADCYDEMYDTIQHELKHATEHICEYYGIDPRSEESARIQGDISREMYKAVSILICPRCGGFVKK